MSGFMAAIECAQYEFIRQLVYDQSRINLGPDRKELVSSRLRKRLRALNLDSIGDYCDLLRSPQGAEEVTGLLDVISTNVTDFFREAKHFDFLTKTALPQWQQDRKGSPAEKFMVWSAACSSGEEPYTIALVLAEYFRTRPGGGWGILGTDISSRMLERAQQAIYLRERVAVPQNELLPRYFQKGGGDWEGHLRVKNSLREHVEFRRLNLTQGPYANVGMFHAIFCRNVMIYFDRKTQEQLIPRLTEHLMPGGHLFVGHSESLIGVQHGLKTIQPSVYRKS
jgi:chemotaxis protein methyltransferase CheR